MVTVILLFFLVIEIDNLRRYLFGVERGVVYNKQKITGMLADEVTDKVYKHAKKIVEYPVNASLDKETGKVRQEKYGQIIAIPETTKKIMIAEEEEKITADIYTINPTWKEYQIKQLKKTLVEFSTSISGSLERRKNIERAVELINNELVFPEKEFSFNEVVGPRTERRGFKKAVEIIEGEYEIGVGGGICQVSTTLYNAVKDLEIKIIELHSHSKQVNYAPEGEDATVAWNLLDFKFENKKEQPIIIKADIINDKLKVRIKGADYID